MKESLKPRVCVVGQLLGRNPGYVTTQGQILADRLSESGYSVLSCSSKINRFGRLADVVRTLVRHRRSIDLIIVEVYSGLSFVLADVASLAAALLGIPAVGVLHGGSLPDHSRKYPRWTKRVLSRFRSLVAPSAFLARGVEPLGLSARVIPNTLDLERYPFCERLVLRPRLIWMRSFHEIYDPEMAIDVLAKVRKRFPEATLVMAGRDKGLLQTVISRADALGLSDAVSFPGFIGHNEKIKLFMEGDIYLNTNRVDNMPVAVLEAFAMGTPVVATRVGGLPDLVRDSETGVLTAPGDASEMAAAVIRLLENPDRAHEVALNARRSVEASEWSNVLRQWESLFREIPGPERLGRRVEVETT